MERPEDRLMTGIPALDTVAPLWREFGTSGFVFAYNVTFRGPEYFYTEYPRDWQLAYEAGSYACFDPVFHWLLLNSGEARWSDVVSQDPHRILEMARAHGLSFGVALARSYQGRKCFLTLARPDRELDEVEIARVAESFATMLPRFHGAYRAGLTPLQRQTLRCLRDGLNYSEVSAQLKVSERAIKARVESARQKLGARNATQAVALAIQRSLI